MEKIFPIIIIVVAIIGFSSSAYFFNQTEISIDIPISIETQSDNSVLQEIEACLEQNLAGESVSVNSFNTNMLLTLKESASKAQSDKELNEISERLHRSTDFKQTIIWKNLWKWIRQGSTLILVWVFTAMVTVIYNDGNSIEKDRILVTYLSFLIIIVFWGSFEQAGGLMNVYAKQKTDLSLFGFFEVPASWFQSVNAIFILIFATLVGSFWVWWKNRGNEYSSIFKMAIGVIIMGWGFFFMSMASSEVVYDSAGILPSEAVITQKSSMYWLVLAYLFHTLGELCASPVALSFITKLAPARWAAFMMGAYFAATGLGNKVAGLIGENASEIGDFWTFTGIGIFCSVFGLLVLLIIKPLKRLVHDAE